MLTVRPKEIVRPLEHPLDGLVKASTRKRSDGRVAHLVSYLRAKVGDLDGTSIDNARACWSLILRAERSDPGGDAVRSIEMLIDVATSEDSWHAKNATNFRYLLNHARQIANEHREKRARAKDPGSIAARVAQHFASKSRSGLFDDGAGTQPHAADPVGY